MHFAKHNILACVCHTLQLHTVVCQLSQSTETLKQLQGHQKTDYREADGWQPKSLCNSIWQRKSLGSAEVQTLLPGPRDFRR